MFAFANSCRGLAAIVVFFLWAAPLSAQQTSCPVRSTFAGVIDERGFPVRGLAAANFRVGMRGQPAKVLSVQEDTQPRRVLLLLDTGANMRDATSGKWQLGVEIVTHVVENSPHSNDLKLAIFGNPKGQGVRLDAGEPISNPISFADLSRGLPLIDRAIQRPPLFDVLADGLSQMQKPRPGDVIFIVTDGQNDSSKIKLGELEHLFLAAGVRIFAVTLPMRYERSGLTVNAPAFSEDTENTDFLNLASATGGKTLRVLPKFYPNEWGFHFDEKERMALATSLQLLYLQMAHFYRVEFELLQPAQKTIELALDVVDASGKSKKSMRLLFPHKLEPCAVPSGK